MRNIFFILLLSPILANSQQYELKPDVKSMFRTIYEPLAVDSSQFDRYYATQTFRLGPTGVTIAEIDTSANPGDTIRFYITGSPQPEPITTVLNAEIDTSLKVGVNGVTWDSITFNGGEIWWWSGSQDFDISQVIYTMPDTADVLSLNSPDKDSLGFEVTIFPELANGTVADSVYVRWDTVPNGYPTSITDGYLAYYGDTTNVYDTIFIDMADDDTVFVSVFHGNGGPYAATTWDTNYNISWEIVDSTGAAFAYQSEFYSDTILARWVNDPTPGSDYDLGMDSTFFELDTAGILRTRDLIYFTLSHDSADSKINLAVQGGLTGNFSLAYGVAGLTWTDSSWVGNGAAWFTTGWDPTNNAIHFSQNDASVAITTNQDDPRGAVAEAGINNGDNDIYMLAQYDPGADQTMIKLNGGSTTTFNQSTGDIHFVANRGSGVGNLDLWIDGVEVAQGGAGTDGMANIDLYMFARNSEGSADWFSSNEIFNMLVGDEYTDVQIGSLYTIIQNHERRSKYSK